MNYEQFLNPQTPNQKIFLVDMRKEVNYHFSELIQTGIEKYIRQHKTILIIVNKKGYASWVICHQCGHIPQCNNCSVSISYHNDQNNTPFGLCHICKSHYDIPRICPKCQSQNIRPYGLGIQQVADHIEKEYAITPIVIDSDKVNSPNKVKKTLEQIRNLKANSQQPTATIILGTSLLTTPIKNTNIDLVIFLNADIWLNIPDYTAAERNFHFLYEAIQNYPQSNIIIQSFNPDQYSIRSACKKDKKLFDQQDAVYRKQYHYPPYSDLCVLLYKHEIEEKLYANVDKLYKELLYYKEKYQLGEIEIYTTPPLIYKKFGKFRYNIVLKWEKLRNFIDIIYSKCNINARGFKTDRQADSII